MRRSFYIVPLFAITTLMMGCEIGDQENTQTEIVITESGISSLTDEEKSILEASGIYGNTNVDTSSYVITSSDDAIINQLISSEVTDEKYFEYEINESGSITITGCTSYDYIITIPSSIDGLTVTAIGEESFSYSRYSGIILPGSITTIEPNAFYGSVNCIGIILSEGVETIGYNAFGYCTSLKMMLIPSTVKNIEGELFNYCNILQSIYIYNTISNFNYKSIYDEETCPNAFLIYL